MSKRSVKFVATIQTKQGKKTVVVKGLSHPMNSFRENEITGHPAYVFYQHGEYYEYVGLTHQKEGNIALDRNPNPDDHEPAHILPEPGLGKSKRMKKVIHGWKFKDSDLSKVDAVKKKSKIKK